MFIRTLSYRLKPEYDHPEGLTKIQVALAKKLAKRKLPGLKYVYRAAQKEGEKYLTITIYESESDANAAFDIVKGEWGPHEYLLRELLRIEEDGTALPEDH